MTAMIKLDQIIVDHDLQPRANMSTKRITELAEFLEEGGKFRDPIIVYVDGDRYYLADGFHRVAAYRQIEFVEVEAEIRQGTKRDAQWYSFSANKDHLGLPREPGDAKRAIEAIFLDPEWSKTSQTKIADHVGVSPARVSQIKLSIKDLIDRDGPVEVTRGGTTYTQDTSNIGKRKHNGVKTAIVADSTDGGEETETEYARDRVLDEMQDDTPQSDLEPDLQYDAPDTGQKIYMYESADEALEMFRSFFDLQFECINPAIHHQVVQDSIKYLRDIAIRFHRESVGHTA